MIDCKHACSFVICSFASTDAKSPVPIESRPSTAIDALLQAANMTGVVSEKLTLLIATLSAQLQYLRAKINARL